jgi:cation:H+ antiporter
MYTAGDETDTSADRRTGTPMALALSLLVVSLAVILIAAELFTNAVEWLGLHLSLNEGAVGSILAAVGTAMPETLIPLIAILFSTGAAHDEIGIGAILGAPFMLSTAAFCVTGVAVLAFARSKRRPREMRLNAEILRRDMGYFIVIYVLAIVASFLPNHGFKAGFAVVLLLFYAFYAYQTVTGGGETGEKPARLYLERAARYRMEEASFILSLLQFLIALGIMIGGARLFVANVQTVADRLDVPALVLALILSPLATELPEKFNSVIWVRQRKDTLAMGNISGAMVFQSCIPVSVGLIFTSWDLTQPALVSAIIALVSTAVVYASITRRGNLSPNVLARAGILYVAFIVYVVLR